ncbi:hypothetical protein ACFX15_022398 [Malus domestica]
MQEKSGAALMSETLPLPLLLGTDGQKGRAAEMVMKSPARDYRSCCDNGCRSWQSWSCRQRRSGEENRGGRRCRQRKLPSVHSLNTCSFTATLGFAGAAAFFLGLFLLISALP